MKVSSLIAQVRYHLNDIEALGFPDELLIAFIKDGLCLISTLKPEDFTVRRIKQADTGSVQCLGECCQMLVSVDAQTDACGNFLKGIKHGRIKNARHFGKMTGKLPAKARQYTVTIRDNVKNSFDIYPPIAIDETVYFLVSCVETPSLGTDGDLGDCKHHQALLHYVLYRAYAMETESQSSISSAASHHQYFFDLLGVMRKIDSQATEDAKDE